MAFYDGTTVLGIATLSGGQASLTTSTLASGTRNLRAHYGGGSGYNPGNSASVLQTVTPVLAGAPQQGSVPDAGCSSPGAIAAGDLNGDGKVDLVVACPGAVSVLLGSGAGTFAPAVTYPAGAPTALVLGDFNGDGKLDVAVTNGTAGTVNLLLGNGDGSLQPLGSGFSVGNTPSALAAGDFNGDGNVDLVTANFGDGTASILLGNGDGTFQPASTLIANPGSISVAIADFNSDGFADLAVLNQTATLQIPSAVMVFLGNGDGTFQMPAQYQTAPGGGSFYPSAVIAADFNGDGQPDLAAASFGTPDRGSFVSVFTNIGGTFNPPYVYNFGPYATALAAPDINGDGAVDLVVTGASANQIEILPGVANTNLGWFGYHYYGTGTYPVALAAADFNGDGRVDLAVVNQVDGTVSILLGGPPSQISCSPSTVTFEASTPAQTQLSQSCTLTTSVSTLNLVAVAPANTFWLTATLSFGQTPPRTVNLQAEVNSLAPGTYSGNIELWDQSNLTDVIVPVTLTVDQSVCSYTLSAASAALPATASSGSFTLTNSRQCSATPSSDSSWLTVTAGPAQTPPHSSITTQTINYSATANPAGGSRTANVTLGPQTFTVTQDGVSLQVISVTPASGSGSTQAFSFQFVDSSGPAGVTANMWFTAAYGTDYSSSCLVYYSGNQLFLFNDDGVTTTQSALGTAGSLANHQCSVDTGSASAVWSGSNLTINLTVTFLPAFAGQLQTWMDITTASADSGWLQEGSWTATAPPNIVSVVSVKPCCNTSGAFQSFVFRYADSSGASNIQTVWFWFTPSYNNGNAAHTCQGYYNTTNNQWNLLNDAGTSWINSATTNNLANSQCTLDFYALSVVADTSDDYYTLTAGEIQFAPSFSGVQQIWAYTASATNNSGWRQVGSYTVASPLKIDSVQPNSGTGQQQTFQVTVTDHSFTNNFVDLQSVDFLLNSTSSLAGACHVHVDNTTGPPTMYLGNDNGVGYVGSVPMGETYAPAVQNSQCTINATSSSVTYSSTDQYTLTFAIAVSFKASFSGAKNIYVGIANPSWSIPLTPFGTWTVAAAPAVLQAVSVSPSGGMGAAVYNTFVFSDSYGPADLTNVQILYGTSTSGAGACWIQINTAASTLALANDAGTGWLGPVQLGNVSLQNSQCSVGTTSGGGQQGNTYTVSLTLGFQPAFGGLKNVYGEANGTSGSTSGWQQLGTWNPANPVPSNVSVSPSSGSGAGATFTFTFADTGGVADLTTVAMLFGTPPNTMGVLSNPPFTCAVTYLISTGNFLLWDDSGQSGFSGAPGSSGTLANSQCSLDLSRSTVTAGTNLVVTLAVSFFPIYQGTLGIWMQAVDISGLTPMQQMGTWAAASTVSTVSLATLPSPSTLGQPVTLTATVSPPAATGRVTFYDGTGILGDAPLASGTATLSNVLLPAGAQSLRAYYSGDTTYGFASASITQTVNAIAGTSFVESAPAPAGTQPAAVVMADVNGDGLADLIVANAGGNNISVLLGNLTGSFTPAAGSPFTAGFPPGNYGLQPIGIAVGDFNNDGLPDLAIANRSNSSIWLLFGNGRGGFTPAQNPFAAGIAPDAIVAGDFNGDGKTDLAIANQSDDTVSIFFGEGTGAFNQAPGSPISAGSGPAALAVADFNGDGNADLAVANATSNNVLILLGSSSGALTLSHTSLSANNPTAIAIGDFNGDGKTDLAYTNAGSNNVTVMLGDGTGGFNPAAGSPFPVGSQPSSLTVGDFNGDGHADLAVANKSDGTISVLLGDGTGGFSAMNGSPFPGGSAPIGVVTGDFNGDGRADLATAASGGNNVTVLLAAPLISPASLPAGTINAAYPPTTLAVTGASGAFTWSAIGLPSGLNIDPNGATISGTPATATGSPFTVQVTATGNNLTMRRTYSLTIFNHCDLSQDAVTSIGDIQTVINEALGVAPPVNDLNRDNVVSVVDVQILVNSAMGLGCAAN